MEISSRDVHEKQFHDAWRGYNQEEVDDFLDRVAEVLERVGRVNESLRMRVSELDRIVAKNRENEAVLKKTLVSAQKAAEDALSNAKARAEKLITEADERVKKANEEARERVKAANEEARERVQTAKEEARERVRAAEEEARTRAEDARKQHADKTRELESSIEQLTTYENELKQRLRAFLKDEIKTLDALSSKASIITRAEPDNSQPPGNHRAEPEEEPEQPEEAQQLRPPQHLHAAPATSYRERESARPSRQAGEPRQIHPEPVDDAPETVVRRRRPVEEPHSRRGIRGFFWGGDQG